MDERDYEQADERQKRWRREDEPQEPSYQKGVYLGIIGSVVVVISVAVILMLTGFLHFGPQTGGKTGVTKAGQSVLTDEVLTKLNYLIGQIDAYYYEDVEPDDLALGLYKGVFEGLDDPYSSYYTKEEYDEMLISTNANYYGIGAGLQQNPDNMQVFVTRVYEDSPAEGAGMKVGDEIVQVDDIMATSMELTDLVMRIRGEEGSTVHLKVYREGETDYLEYDVVRGKVNIPTVAHKMLENNIGYIQVAEFATTTPVDFDAAIQDLTAQGMEAMIVDLRSNGGGLVTACQQMLDEILPEGTVVYTEDKYGNRENYDSDAEHFMKLPIAVLVNGNTASASEIFAGAIHDFEYGTLIGTKTYGKGVVQSIKPLSDGSAYKVTVSKYFTPNGENIHGTGIKPDIEIEYEYNGDAEADYDEMQDNQIVKALEVLKNQL